MSMRSRHLGAVGTIIDGNVRDIAEQQSMEWPVSASVLISFQSTCELKVTRSLCLGLLPGCGNDRGSSRVLPIGH